MNAATGACPRGFLRAPARLRLPGSGVGVAAYACGFSDDRFNAGLFAEYGITEPEVISRSVPRRRAQYLAGRICARQTLRSLSEAAADGQLLIAADRRPMWPTGFKGSISHCAGMAVAVSCTDCRARGIGVDVEDVLEDHVWLEIGESVVHGSDREFLTSASGSLGMAAARTVLFSAKESFFKSAFGMVGRVFDFDALSLVRLDVHAGTATAVVNLDLCREVRRMDEVEIGFSVVDGLVATLCILD